MPSSIALFNGSIHTMVPDHPQGEALLIRHGLVEAVGSDADIRERAPDAERIDLKGRTVLPGFNDGHLHALNYGRLLETEDLRLCRSPEAVLEKIRPALGAPGPWITGRGWNQESFAPPPSDSRCPFDRTALDGLSTERPILLERVCGHIGVVNSAGLHRLGLDRENPFAPHLVDRDETGAPSGVLREDALEWARGKVYCLDAPRAAHHLRAAGKALARLGITSISSDDLGALDTNLDLLYRTFGLLETSGPYPVRLYEQFLLPRHEDLALFLTDARPAFPTTPRLRPGPLKLLLDGSLGARTAALRHDYADQPGNRGLLLYTPETLRALVSRAHGEGLSVAIHCIGDRSLALALDVFEAVQKETPRPTRHAVVHCQLGDPLLFDRMAHLGIAAIIQPSFAASDQTMAPSRLGRARLAGAYPGKSLLARGILAVGSSDAPVEDPSPLRGIWAAVTRRRSPGSGAERWRPEEGLSVSQALALYTRNGAGLSFDERRKGQLAPGYFGDLVALGADPLRVLPDEIPAIPVDLTVCGGEITWRDPAL